MKEGRTLQDLAIELDRQVKSRKDFVAPQSDIAVKVVQGEVVLDGFNGGGDYPLTNIAHSQLGTELGIPKAYYDRMRTEQPELLAHNVRTWLKAEPGTRRMVRTLDHKARAILSPKYRPLDNYDLMRVILPALRKMDAVVKSAELTESRLYVKAILPKLSDELPAGLEWGVGHHIFDRNSGVPQRNVVSAIVIANSEVGMGTLRVEPSVFTALCTNLAILKDAAMKKYHVGRSFEADSNFEVFRDDTRKADDEAFWLKVRDVVNAAFDPDKFRAAMEMIRRAGEAKIVSNDLPKVVEVAVGRLGLPEKTEDDIMSWLAKGGQLNQWGLSSAITRTAQDADSYEDATTLERVGGEVLALPPAQWEKISKGE